MNKILLVVAILIASQTHIWSKNLKGKVRSGRQPLANVVVTDGLSFTQTNEKGVFSFDVNDDAGFVYIFTPAGYSAPFESGSPQFYQRLSEVNGQVDFDLQALPFANEDYAFVAMGDPQVKTLNQFERFEKETIADIKETIAEYHTTETNVVGIALGDIVFDNLPLFTNYKAAIATLGIPFYPVIGNHDHDQKIIDDNTSSSEYSNQFGPTDYGFNVGQQYYIVLDNIIYSGRKSYITDISDEQLEWVRNYLQYVPKGADVVFAMHAPFKNHYNDKMIDHGEALLDICKDYNLRFMSGHTHLNTNTHITEGIMEYNVGAACGAWWSTQTGQDGTPNGYKVFEASGDQYDSYFKATGKDRQYQMELYDRGMIPEKTNAVVAKVWNWDTDWKVEWYADEVLMGEMKQFATNDPGFMQFRQTCLDKGKRASKSVQANFYFAAHPSLGTKKVRVVVTDSFGNYYEQDLELNGIEVEGHRGAAGVMPENTIEAMLYAVGIGVNTLELDLQVTKDGEVIVSHDAHINPKFTLDDKGEEISEKQAKKRVFSKMKYDDVIGYDTGTKLYDRFPDQKKINTHIPLLSALIDSVELYVAKNGLSPVRYNIEIKSSKEKEKQGLVLDYDAFSDKAMEVLLSKELGERLLVQSFDTRCLNYINEKYPDTRLAYLVSNNDGFANHMAQLNFQPETYSPNYKLVDAELIQSCKEKGMKVVPWTVDDDEAIIKMLDLGVDGIISNYPNRVLRQTRGYEVQDTSIQ